MDTVYKSSRIYSGEGREFAGGILFSPVDGKVKNVFRSNNELDSFLQDNAEVKVRKLKMLPRVFIGYF